MTKLIIITPKINDEIMQNKIVQVSKVYIFWVFLSGLAVTPKSSLSVVTAKEVIN